MANSETAYGSVIRSLGKRRVVVHLALVDCGGCAGALSHLANDLEEALGVYERLGAGDGSPARQFDIEPLRLDATELANGVGSPLSPDLPVGTVLYAISCTNDHSPEAAEAALGYLANACAARGVAWGGGVAVGGGLLVEPCAGGPRMGRMRRARSEAIDRLILAIRSRCAATDLPDAPARGTFVAKCPVPAFAYRLAARLYTS